MKKIFSFIVAVIMVVSICVTCFAAGNSISCTASKTDVKIGETVSVSVTLTNSDAFKAFGLSFEYNTNVFEFVNGEWFIQGALLKDVDKAKNKAAVAYKDPTVQNGEIFTFDFKVKSGIEVGTYDISVVPTMKNGTDTINITGDTVKVNVVEGVVTTPSDTSSTTTPSGHTHKFGDFVTDLEPTCTEPGIKSRHCSVCNQRSEITNIDPSGHDWTDWNIEVEATNESAGLKSKTCNKCGEKLTAEIAKLSTDGHEHTFGEWEITKEPTCKDKGEQIHQCTYTDCEAEEKEDIAKKPHEYGKWSIERMPTLEKEGLLQCVCSVCNDVKEQPIDKLTQDDSSSTTDILIIVIIGLGAVILIGAGIVFAVGIYKRRKHK